MTNKELLETKWVNRWAGSYTFLSCSYWARHYFTILNKILGEGFKKTLFIYRNGTASFYVDKKELDSLGKILADRVINNRIIANEFLDELKRNSDKLTSLMEKLAKKIPNIDQYKEFLEIYARHLAYHVFMKKTVDYLPQDILDEIIIEFTDARIYSEPVYSKTEIFFRQLASLIGEKEGVNNNLVTCLSGQEMEKYLSNGVLPDIDVLNGRSKLSVILSQNGKVKIITGDEAERIT